MYGLKDKDRGFFKDFSFEIKTKLHKNHEHPYWKRGSMFMTSNIQKLSINKEVSQCTVPKEREKSVLIQKK